MLCKQAQITLLLLLMSGSAALAQNMQASAALAPGGDPNNDVHGTRATPTDYALQPDYVIGPDDVLVVNVWKEPEISRTVPVRPDGRITVPLLGDVEATGLTTRQLQTKIKQQLKNYLGNPEVTVIVEEVRSRQVNVVGEVYKPGSYNLTKPTTVLDLIASAGGFREFAKIKKIYVLRIEKGQPRRLKFNYKEVIKGYQLQQNVQLDAGDTIVVP